MNSFTFSRAEGFLTVSENLRKEVLSRFNVTRSKVQTVSVPITNQFDQESYPDSVREKYGIDEDRIIISVTNLRFCEKYRGISEMVPEVLDYLAKNQDTAWVIAGGGYYQSELKKDIARGGDDESVHERVYNLGYVNRIEDIFLLGDVFVYNSYLDGYPNVILESQMAGVPVVTTNQEGMSEQIDNFKTGLFFSQTNQHDLSKKIDMLLNNSKMREEISKKAYQKVQNYNDQSSISGQLEEALSKIIL